MFFSKYGEVVEHQIIRDHTTNRSRGFGFIVFDNEQVVDDLLVNGNMIDMMGSQVKIKKAEPKKAGSPPPATAFGRDSRARTFGDGFGGYGDTYGSFGSSEFGPGPFRAPGGLGSGRLGGYGGYGGSGLGGYGRGPESYGNYGSGYGGSFESGSGPSYGGAGGLHGSRTGYAGNSRYHPYSR